MSVGIYLDLYEVIEDASLDLPAPLFRDFETDVEVTVSGIYRAATRFDPPEYPEAEAQATGDELAEQALTAYRGPLAAAGTKIDADQVAEFLRVATRKFDCLIDAACVEALESDSYQDEGDYRD